MGCRAVNEIKYLFSCLVKKLSNSIRRTRLWQWAYNAVKQLLKVKIESKTIYLR